MRDHLGRYATTESAGRGVGGSLLRAPPRPVEPVRGAARPLHEIGEPASGCRDLASSQLVVDSRHEGGWVVRIQAERTLDRSIGSVEVPG